MACVMGGVHPKCLGLGLQARVSCTWLSPPALIKHRRPQTSLGLGKQKTGTEGRWLLDEATLSKARP